MYVKKDAHVVFVWNYLCIGIQFTVCVYIYTYAHENGTTYAFICECSHANLFFLEEGNMKDLCVLHIVFFVFGNRCPLSLFKSHFWKARKCWAFLSFFPGDRFDPCRSLHFNLSPKRRFGTAEFERSPASSFKCFFHVLFEGNDD